MTNSASIDKRLTCRTCAERCVIRIDSECDKCFWNTYKAVCERERILMRFAAECEYERGRLEQLADDPSRIGFVEGRLAETILDALNDAELQKCLRRVIK